MTVALDVIQPHATWDVLDSSKLTCYMECPRKYFYRYLLGWHPDTPNNHLVFGSAWHVAMEHLLLNKFTGAAIAEAQLKFLEYYRERFPPGTDGLFEPKSPLNACESIIAYHNKFASEMREYTTLYTELAGLVLVSAERTMVFKCDAIVQHTETGHISGLDFKTSQRRFDNWGEHWTMSTQMLTYLHALHCLYPDDDELQMLVRCAFFYSVQKRSNERRPTEFADHPIRKSLSQMQSWLVNVNTYISNLEYDMECLEEENTDKDVMQAFPMRTTSCFNWGRQCEFFDFCNTWSNPLARADQAPIGFNVEWWNPLERPEVRTKLNLATHNGDPVEMDGE